MTPAMKLLRAPVAEWPLRILSTRANLQEVESELAALVQRAALLEAYISRRYNTGCGDQGHDASAKHANAVLMKIRRALGYSYPENTPLRMAP